MQCIEITSPGGPESLRLVTRPDPIPGPGEVLIEVNAAGVNGPDLAQRRGLYPPPPGASDIPGLEVAGRIVAIASSGAGPPQSASGRTWRIGDEVMALIAGGGYATLAVAPGAQCLPIPEGLSFAEAAAIPETFFTVWTNVFESGRLSRGEWLLVHGGAGGIGTTAIQLATALGAHVIATAGSDERARASERLGAIRGVNYKTEDFVAVVDTVTGGSGVDVILDVVGGSYAARNIRALRRGGRLVQIAVMGGAIAEISLAAVMTKRLTITGSTLRPRSVEEKGAIARELEARVWPLIAEGRVRPVLDRALPLREASRAHELLEEGEITGKVVLLADTSRAERQP